MAMLAQRPASSLSSVGFGVVAGLARPGGNITGVSIDAGPEVEAKRLELLQEAFPKVSRVGVLAIRFYSYSERNSYREQLRLAAKDWVFCYLPPGCKAPFRRQSIDVCSR